ncbi:MAG: histidine phosphatase family protein [bacterium]|nr:histidine phosphatase family protein [bacterium]
MNLWNRKGILMDRPCKYLLARHTETDWNVQDRYSGQSDEPRLNEQGAVQAWRIGRQVSGYDVRKVVCSDLSRAYVTAQLILLGAGWMDRPDDFRRGLPAFVVDRRLRELSVGQMDGMTKEEARVHFTDPLLSTRHPGYDFTTIGGESREQVIRRHREAFDEHIPIEGVCLFVGHGTSLRTFLESCGVTEPIVQGGFVQLLYRKTA